MSQQNLNKVYSQVKVVESITSSDKTLTKFDSGKVFLVTLGGQSRQITLPLGGESDLVGWECDFVFEDLSAASVTCAFVSSANCDTGAPEGIPSKVVSSADGTIDGVTFGSVPVTVAGDVLFTMGQVAGTGAKVTLTCTSVDSLGTAYHLSAMVNS